MCLTKICQAALHMRGMYAFFRRQGIENSIAEEVFIIRIVYDVDHELGGTSTGFPDFELIREIYSELGLPEFPHREAWIP